MSLHRIGFIFIGVLLSITAAAQPSEVGAPAAAVKPPPRESFHVYLLMGQSNMAGRGVLVPQTDNPRVLALNSDGQWVIAREPIHPKTSRVEPGAGPGVPFANEMLQAKPGITIGLVPCAVGGTSLKRWVKGADLYEQAVKRGRLAAQSGVLAGVLWHQGETDTTDKSSAEAHEANLTRMLADLRQDLGAPNLPIVVGQLGDFLTPEKYPHVDAVRTAIKQVSASAPGVGYADSAGLAHKGDREHFSTDAQRELGARFARAMLALEATPTPTADTIVVSAVPPDRVIAVWPEGKMPGGAADEPEGDLPSRGDNARRITNISQPTLTFLPAPGKSGPSPAMIVCPGGGYSYVVFDKEGTEVAAWLNANGISALVLKYRTPNNRAGAFQDIQRALSVVRGRAAELNIDPQRLGVIGFSAGGHLAANASTRFGERTYAGIDAIDQQSCRPDFAVLVYPAYLDDKNGHVAPDLNLRAAIPPTLIVHSEDDKNYVPGSKLFAAALEQAKVAHAFKLYQTGGHGYGLRSTKDASAWPQFAAEWFKTIGVR